MEKKKFHDIHSKIEEAVNSKRAEMILEFNNQKAASIKSFAVKKVTMGR